METNAPRAVTGRLDVHPRGFGFLAVSPSGAGEALSAFVPPAELHPFLSGDIVSGMVSQATDGRWSASGLALVARSRELVFGEVKLRDGAALLKLDREVGNAEWPLETGGVEAKAGDAVVARVRDGKLVLARKLLPEEDRSLEQVLVRHGLRRDFEPDVLEDVQRARAMPHAATGRRDLRSIPTMTVDSRQTRDIDDAISVLPAGPDGALRLLVSIADAAEFVTEGSPLDRAARERATSVYLAREVLRMLPEALSEDWLSLVPDEDRLCLTVELRLDPEGRLTAADVYESIIHSTARLDYDEVAAFLDRGELSAAMAPVREAMPWFRAAGARLAVARAARGGIDQSRDEARFTFDAAGAVSGIEVTRPTSAHLLIERFMVAANEAIAGWLVARGVPALFRVQGRPEPQRVADLHESALQSGFAAGFGRELTPLALGVFDRQISGAASEPALRSVLRRLLGPARYTVVPSMHFGLAAPGYLHFTSPIRRYADLKVHRTLKQYLRGRRDFAHEDPEVEALAAHLNERVRVASRADADRRRVLEARVLAAHVGETFSARVTRVKPFGLLALLDGMQVEGMVPLDALPGGPYRPDARELSLIGPERRFTLGQALKVRVVATDERQGRIDLAPVE